MFLELKFGYQNKQYFASSLVAALIVVRGSRPVFAYEVQYKDLKFIILLVFFSSQTELETDKVHAISQACIEKPICKNDSSQNSGIWDKVVNEKSLTVVL